MASRWVLCGSKATFRALRMKLLFFIIVVLLVYCTPRLPSNYISASYHTKEYSANYDSSPHIRSSGSSNMKSSNKQTDFILRNMSGKYSLEEAGDFDVSYTDRFSLQRPVPEVRHGSCFAVQYLLTPTSVSVIIVFHDEPLSTLLRTIWSVINRTRPRFLLEIILVDDGGKVEFFDVLQVHLAKQFFSSNTNYRVIRLPENRGLIQARLTGARSAHGDILTFLDSHCEVSIGWLEPLLQLIQRDRKTIACPIVDTIVAETIEYEAIDGFRATGLFSWSLFFTWGSRTDAEALPGNEWKPFSTATFPGGLFAVDRRWFFEVGSYDEAMTGWGGENLEMSFRVWMCHGSIVFVPCSRVGHVSRDHDFTSQAKSMDINIVRLATVWMDDYIRFFYMARPDLKNFDVGNVSDRKDLRTRLQCHSFSWYLRHVCPSKTVPDQNTQAWGQLRNQPSGLCLTSTGYDEHDAYPFEMRECVSKESPTYILQLVSLGTDGRLRREEWCLDSSPSNNSEIRSYHCDEGTAGTWMIQPGSALRNNISGKCLAVNERSQVLLADCLLSESVKQVWNFEH